MILRFIDELKNECNDLNSINELEGFKEYLKEYGFKIFVYEIRTLTQWGTRNHI